MNYKDLGGDVTEMTILGNDVFADALEERLKERKIPLRILKRTDRPTAAAKMDLVDGDKKHLHFEGNAMEEIELQDDDLEFVKQFDIIYAERWAKVGRYIKEIRQEGRYGYMIFLNVWNRKVTTRSFRILIMHSFLMIGMTNI